VLTRVLALLAAGLCVGGALHLGGVLHPGGALPEAAAEGVPPPTAVTHDRGALDIVGRVMAPAALTPARPSAEPGPGTAEREPLVAVEPFVPVRVDVAAAGVRGPIDPLGVDDAGELEVPAEGSRAGWWSGGYPAGAGGPTVVVGHVNEQGGQAGVFHALALLAPGDRARLVSADGRFVEYEVTTVETVAKREFPTEAVYGPTTGSELRLITCGGPFNPLRGEHRDNVVVHATLVDPS
jgi:hypothetical protein